MRGNDTPDPQIRAPDTRSERLHLRASGARAPGPRLRQARGCRSAPGRPQQSQKESKGGWAASKAYTAGVPCPYTNSTADSERQRSQLSLAPVSITPPFRAGAKRFYQNVQRPVVPAVTPQLPSGDPVSPGWTPSEPHQPSRGLGERRPQRWPRAYNPPPYSPCGAGRSAQGKKCHGAGSGARWPSTSAPQAAWTPTWRRASGGSWAPTISLSMATKVKSQSSSSARGPPCHRNLRKKQKRDQISHGTVSPPRTLVGPPNSSFGP